MLFVPIIQFFSFFRFNVSCCVQEYSGCRVVKHNFRYRVSIRTCFLSVIYAPSCNRCVLITPVPGARSPCTSPSAWGSFPDSIEPRGMHQRGAPPPFPLPPCRCNSAPAWAVPACQVRTHPRLFRLFHACSCASPCYSPQARHAPPAHSSACPHSPTLARRAPRPPARVFARPPARGFARLPARTPAHAFTLPRPLPPSRSPLSSPVCHA